MTLRVSIASPRDDLLAAFGPNFMKTCSLETHLVGVFGKRTVRVYNGSLAAPFPNQMQSPNNM